jgi:hypothetical protein
MLTKYVHVGLSLIIFLVGVVALVKQSNLIFFAVCFLVSALVYAGPRYLRNSQAQDLAYRTYFASNDDARAADARSRWISMIGWLVLALAVLWMWTASKFIDPNNVLLIFGVAAGLILVGVILTAYRDATVALGKFRATRRKEFD